MVNMFVNTIGYFVVLYEIESLKTLYILIFLVGFSSSIRNTVGYSYCMELIPDQFQKKVGSF